MSFFLLNTTVNFSAFAIIRFARTTHIRRAQHSEPARKGGLIYNLEQATLISAGVTPL
jgi:hypothetical protein